MAHKGSKTTKHSQFIAYGYKVMEGVDLTKHLCMFMVIHIIAMDICLHVSTSENWAYSDFKRIQDRFLNHVVQWRNNWEE